MEIDSEKLKDNRRIRISLKPCVTKTMEAQTKIATVERYTALYTQAHS